MPSSPRISSPESWSPESWSPESLTSTFSRGGALWVHRSPPRSPPPAHRRRGCGAGRLRSTTARFGELSRELPAQHVLGQVCPRAGQPALEKLGGDARASRHRGGGGRRDRSRRFPLRPRHRSGSTTATSGLGLDGTTSPLAEILATLAPPDLSTVVSISRSTLLAEVNGAIATVRPSKGLAPAANQRAAASGDTRPMSAPRHPHQRCSTNDSGPRNFPARRDASGTTCRAAARPRRRRRNLMEREPRGPNTTSVARASHAWPAHREPPRRETVAPYLVRSAEPNPLSATRGGRSVEGAGAGVRAGTAAAGVALDLDFDAEAFFDFDAGVFDFADGFSAGDLCAGVFSAGVFSAGVFSAGVFASAGDFLAGVFALGVLAGAGPSPSASRGRRASDARRRARGRTPSPSPCHRVCASRAERPLPLPLPRRSLPGLPREVERDPCRQSLASSAPPASCDRGEPPRPPPPLLLLPPPPHSASA